MERISGFLNSSPGGAAPEAELSSKTEKYVSVKWTELSQAYYIYHSWIWETFLMYAGQLWLRYNTNRRIYELAPPKDDFVPQPRINRFAPAIDAIASNFAQIPEVEAIPSPIDDVKAMAVAEIANKLAEHAIKDCALRSDYKSQEDKIGLSAQLFVLAGCFFTEVYPEDEQLGTRPVMEGQNAFSMQCVGCDIYQNGLEAPPATCPQCNSPDISVEQTDRMMPAMDETGQQKTEPIIQKKIRCRVGNPLYYFPRAGAKNMGDVGMILSAERLSLDEIWSRWKIKVEADAEYSDGWNANYENALSFFYMGFNSSTLQNKDSALVIQAYCEPNKVADFPDGFWALYINKKVHIAKPWNEAFVEHPLTKFDYKTLPTLFFPRSVAFDLVGVQKEQCDYKSIIKLHAMTSAVDPWVIDMNTLVTEISGRADKTIKWRSIGPGSKEPHRAGHGSLDPGVYAMDNKLDQEFEHISAAVQAFRGEQPGTVKAGVAIESLRAQAEFMFSGPVTNWNNGWKETVRKIVKCYQKFCSLAQIQAIVGPDRVSEIEEFRRADLDTCLDWASTRNGLPRTRDERRQEMMVLFDRGLLDVNDPNVREKAFELFGDTGMLQTFNKDASRARFENKTIEEGGQPIFMPEIEDLRVHLSIHDDKIKSSDFLRWPQPAQQALIAHRMATKQALDRLAAQQVPPPSPGTKKPAAPPPHQEVQSQ